MHPICSDGVDDFFSARRASKAIARAPVNTLIVHYSKSRRKAAPSPNANTVASYARPNKSTSNVFAKANPPPSRKKQKRARRVS